MSKLTHDLNNKLAIVWGYTQLLQADSTFTEAQKAKLAKIADGCAEMAELLKKSASSTPKKKTLA